MLEAGEERSVANSAAGVEDSRVGTDCMIDIRIGEADNVCS